MTTHLARIASTARLPLLVALAAACGRDTHSDPGRAMVLTARTTVWNEPTTSGAPLTHLDFGEQIVLLKPVPDPSPGPGLVEAQLVTGERGWISAGAVAIGAKPAVVTRAVAVRPQPRADAPVGDAIPRLGRVAVSEAEAPWVRVTAEGGEPAGWIPEGRLTYHTGDIALAGVLADRDSTTPPSERADRLTRLVARPDFSRSIFAGDVYTTIAALRSSASTSSRARPSLAWLGRQLGLAAPDRFAEAAAVAAGRKPETLERFEAGWRPDCASTCLLSVAGSAQRLMSDSSLIPFLIEAVRSAPSTGYVVALNALRVLSRDLEAAALRSALDGAPSARAIAAARMLHELGDSSAVRWVRRATSDPTADDPSAVLSLAAELGIASGADHIIQLDRLGVLDTMASSRVWRLVGDALHGPNPADRETSVAIIRALEERPRHWTTLANMFVGTPAMDDPELRNDVAAIAYRLMTATEDSVQTLAPGADLAAWQSIGVMFAQAYPSAALVTGVIATLDDPPHRDSYQAQMAFLARQRFLVTLTGLDTAPYLDLPSKENRDRVHAFWDTWWTQHINGFRPVPAQIGERAVATWRRVRPR